MKMKTIGFTFEDLGVKRLGEKHMDINAMECAKGHSQAVLGFSLY